MSLPKRSHGGERKKKRATKRGRGKKPAPLTTADFMAVFDDDHNDIVGNPLDILSGIFDDDFNLISEDDYAATNLSKPTPRASRRLVSLLDLLLDHGWVPGACAGWSPTRIMGLYTRLAEGRTQASNLPFAAITCELLAANQPDTVRGTMYLVVSSGLLTDTSSSSYNRVQGLLKRLRNTGVVPFSWISDNIRQTVKPSSWSGLEDFADTVRDAYRKDFWAGLPDYPQIIVEKDSVAGRIVGVTEEYDVALHPLRGYSSITFAHDIAEDWKLSGKIIYVYYIGDWDPSGLNIERSVRETITHYADGVTFHWKRLAVLPEHFDEFNILPLAPKKKDTRYKKFVAAHGERCAEVEAIPATVLRRLVREAIESHIPQDEWARLKALENIERHQWHELMDKLGGDAA